MRFRSQVRPAQRHGGHAPALQVRRQAAPGGLDFGQFGHRASVADGCGPRYGKRRLADARGAARTNVNGQSDAPLRMNAAAPYPPAGMAFDRARPHHAWTRSPDPAYPMPASTLDFLAGGLLQFGWGEMLLYLLVATQLTIFAVTLYLHRSQAPRGVDFHPAIAPFFRLWTWLTTSMIIRELVALHRKPPHTCEHEDNPHTTTYQHSEERSRGQKCMRP